MVPSAQGYGIVMRAWPRFTEAAVGKQDYKKTRPMLRATRLKAEAKKTALGVKEVALVLAAILVFLLAFYAFFYLNISNEVDLDLDPDEN
ncbi:triple QxxK/R motif-containing protein isoform X2 [Ciconia boyciana]|uniref:triple QxxK/R motif-containing protein isoform X2 n=1 Tax=Ciconia boyciana TaxID=52775 RepID=UPI003B9FB531